MLDFLTIYSHDNKQLPQEIVSQFIDRPVCDASVAYQKACYKLSNNRDRMLVYAVSAHPCNATEEMHVAKTRSGLSFFSGWVFQNKHVVQNILELSPFDFETDLSKFFFGTFSNCEEDILFSSVLGSYNLYVGIGQEVTAFSNVPALCARAIGNHSINQANIAPIVMSSLIPQNNTAWGNVYCLPTNSGVRISSNNTATLYSLVEKMYERLSQEEWNSKLEFATEQMNGFYFDMVNSPLFMGNSYNVAFLTGGLDSRVMLSSLINLGVAQNIQYELISDPEDADAVSASQIADIFGLDLQIVPKQVAPTPEEEDEALLSAVDRALIRTKSEQGILYFTTALMNAFFSGPSYHKRLKSMTGYKRPGPAMGAAATEIWTGGHFAAPALKCIGGGGVSLSFGHLSTN